MVTKNCKKCNKEFQTGIWEIRRGRGKYCSKPCALSDRTITEETRLKLSKIQVGAKSHFWRGGTTLLNKQIRADVLYQIWRDKIFKRDNYSCRRCNDTTYVGHKIKIHPHHLFPFAKLLKFYDIKSLEDARGCLALWDVDNGITLCLDCHKKTESYLKH